MSVVHLNDSTNDLAKLPRSAHSYVNNQVKNTHMDNHKPS